MSTEERMAVAGFLLGIAEFLRVTIDGLTKEREIVLRIAKVYSDNKG